MGLETRLQGYWGLSGGRTGDWNLQYTSVLCLGWNRLLLWATALTWGVSLNFLLINIKFCLFGSWWNQYNKLWHKQTLYPASPHFTSIQSLLLLCLLVSASLLHSVLTSPFGEATSNGRGFDWCKTVHVCQMLPDVTFILCSSLLQELQFHRDFLASASVTIGCSPSEVSLPWHELPVAPVAQRCLQLCS